MRTGVGEFTSVRQLAYTPQAGLGAFLFRCSCISPRQLLQVNVLGPGRVSAQPRGERMHRVMSALATGR